MWGYPVLYIFLLRKMEGDCRAVFVYQVRRASTERQGEVSGCWIQMNIGFVVFDNQTIFHPMFINVRNGWIIILR